jgi:hypothetical protein
MVTVGVDADQPKGEKKSSEKKSVKNGTETTLKTLESFI